MSNHSEPGCPDIVLASIAWYPHALDDVHRGLVESHAAACAACRAELAFVQGEVSPELPLPDADEVYAGVLARIAQSEALQRVGGMPPPSTRASAGSAPRRRRIRVHTGGAFGTRPAMLAAGLALALLCGALGALGGLLLASDPAPTYQTVAEIPATPAAPSAAPALEVVFRADVRAEQVHAALRAIGGQIVSGPTQVGAYRVELPATADVAAAARLLEGNLLEGHLLEGNAPKGNAPEGNALEGERRGVAVFAQPAH